MIPTYSLTFLSSDSEELSLFPNFFNQAAARSSTDADELPTRLPSNANHGRNKSLLVFIVSSVVYTSFPSLPSTAVNSAADLWYKSASILSSIAFSITVGMRLLKSMALRHRASTLKQAQRLRKNPYLPAPPV